MLLKIYSESALTLLQSGVLLVDDETLAFADNDLAIAGSSFNAAADFHNFSFLETVDNASLGHVVGTQFDSDFVAGKNTDEKLPHLATDVGENFFVVLQAHPEHGVWQSFSDFGVECDLVIFGHLVRAFQDRVRRNGRENAGTSVGDHNRVFKMRGCKTTGGDDRPVVLKNSCGHAQQMSIAVGGGN